MGFLSDLTGLDNAPKVTPRPKDDGAPDASSSTATVAASGNTASAKLDHIQQQIDQDTRQSIARGVVEYLAQYERLGHQQRHLAGHVMHDEWSTFWPWVYQINRVPSLSHKGIIIMGGWHRKFPPQIKDIEPEKDVLQAVNVLGLCHQALALSEHDLPAYERFIAKNQGELQLALGIRLRAGDDMLDALKASFGMLKEEAKRALAFMASDAIMFSPSPDDPAAGWKEFYSFFCSYKHLPNTVKDLFGPCYLLIHWPS